MSDANVLEALDRASGGYKRPALNNIVIYGRVRCIIEKPSILGEGIKETNGHFAIIDAYALKCLGEDYFREGSSYDTNRIYFTKGSILIYIDDTKWVGRDVKVFGKNYSFGATIRRQDSNIRSEGITAFMFGPPIQEGRRSVFPLVPNCIKELTKSDSDARGTVLEDFLILATSKDEIPYPETLDSIIPYTGVEIYDEITVSNPVPSREVGSIISVVSEPKAEPKVEPKSESKGIFLKNGYTNLGKRVDISKIDMGLTFHLEGQPRADCFYDFKDDIANSAKLRREFVKNSGLELSRFSRNYKIGDIEQGIKDAFIQNVARYPKKTLGGYSSIRCKNYIDTFIDNFSQDLFMSEEILRESEIPKRSPEEATRRGIEKLKGMIGADSSILYGKTGDEDIDNLPMLNHVWSFAMNVLGTCTGIGYDTLLSCMRYCDRYADIDPDLFKYLLLRCPYYLGLVGTGLSLVDCDILYYSIGKECYEEDMEGYNELYRSYLVMLDTLSNCSKGKYEANSRGSRGINTFVKTADYKNADPAYPTKNSSYLRMVKFPAKSDIKDLLELLLDSDITLSRQEVSYIQSSDWYSDGNFQELCEMGIINTLDDYCALERSIEQEFMIYEVFEKMGKLPTGISDSTIERVISDFERDRGFKLEGLQREGIKLCKNRAGVLSGCAGSGKTTTSDCITEVIKTLDKVNIVYCTPTGKACRRLAEVVHSTVKTIHSQFGVGLGGSSYLRGAYRPQYKPEDAGKPETTTVYILDEMAMCSTELMYNIAKSITEDDLIYFLGDVKQLPPIGGGCPFKVLMSILPCVELGVSKRAAEGSLVNYNTSLINFLSTPYCTELMYDGNTFIARDCPDKDIALEVKNCFTGFIDGSLNGTKYSEDDIQVITGYQAKTKASSTSRLNTPLQEVLRSSDKVLYYKSTRENGAVLDRFYQNDRVIYINRNSYDMCRYVYDKGVFHKVLTTGCVNGEMGKLIGVFKSASVTIDDVIHAKAGEGIYADVTEEELKELQIRYDSRADEMRSDKSFQSDEGYFIIVKVYDTDLKRDVLVLLRGRGKRIGGDLCLSGGDLDNLALAYALTCHKMQGSQSKVVIAVFESGGSPEFMNRNMINTIITRSQGIVCCVGSVLGEQSMLNRGRKCVSESSCRDILAVMSGDVGWLEG